MTTARQYLETATNIAVIMAALVVSGIFLLNYFRPTDSNAPRLREGFQTGQQLQSLPGITYSDAPKTLVIALNTTCGFCTESVPFYNKLAEAHRVSKSPLRIVTVFPNSEDDVKRYVQEHQLALVSKASVNFQPLHIVGTPTMLLLDQDGKVIDFWLGRPSESAQAQVMKYILS